MTGRHARDDAPIDLSHPARMVLALLALGLAAPGAILGRHVATGYLVAGNRAHTLAPAKATVVTVPDARPES
ncbi:hypothetical protein GCM10010324_03900 [Streptomyces hiroshimensis]|uniref:Uncharacterized protein n=1 Tax=Streptomyces hiroshimensis TaxID=66424 RepID=A0ABQ2Y5P7_9ACTN|nr:hypothetical protein GCM10010324_03900 [Streptomyces hiroshimensis]